MSAAQRDEDAWTARLSQRLAIAPERGIGIGDDAAVLRWSGRDVVVAKDVIVDGRHFDLKTCGVEAAVYKAVAINLSDLAAVAAVPDAFLLGVVLPRQDTSRLAEALLAGLERVVATLGIPCVGGDTNVADGPLTLSVTVVGHPGPGGFIARTGARPGDVLSVTGPLGGSRAGRHLRPTPRVREAQALVSTGRIHALIDCSDGLSSDCARLCDASNVGATLNGADIPVHADVPDDSAFARLSHALHDGEDFELLLAHAPFDGTQDAALREAGVRVHRIGHCETAPGLRLRWEGGVQPLSAEGFDHFTAG